MLLLFVHQALHLVLAPGAGIRLGIAPAAAWIAIRGSLDPRILWLTAAVTFWTAGFDIIYSCQDYEFDRARGPVQRAAPARHRAARCWLRGCCTSACSSACSRWCTRSHLGPAQRWRASAVVAALLIYEHSLVQADDLSRVDAAFFTMNGYVSVLFFVFWAADIFLSAECLNHAVSHHRRSAV